MSTPPPASFFDQLFDRVGRVLQPPTWVVEETQRRLVLMLNHVLQQEPEAQARLKRQTGRVVEAHWRIFNMRLQATPAGLLDLAPPLLHPDLTLTLTDESPIGLAQAALRGEKPPVRIAGDVQLAAEVQWLVDHVRWDIEEDLARVFGDAPAHAIAQVGSRVADALRRFVGGAAAAAAAASPASMHGVAPMDMARPAAAPMPPAAPPAAGTVPPQAAAMPPPPPVTAPPTGTAPFIPPGAGQGS